MFGPANLLCLVFVATATCNILPDGLAVSKQTLNETMRTSRNEITRYYAIVKTRVDRAILQIEFERPYVAPRLSTRTDKYHFPDFILPPTAECYEYLKTQRKKNNTQLTRCSAQWLQRARDYQALLDQALELANDRLKDEDEAAKNCETWYDATFAKNSLAILCIDRIKNKLSEIVAEAKSHFSQLAKNAERVVKVWIPEAGRCMLGDYTLPDTLIWFNACKFSVGVIVT